MLSKRERLLATVARKKTDRTPVSFWRNWPIDNKDPEQLARVSLDSVQKFDLDFLKVSPSHIYIVEDYGRSGKFDGNPRGVDVNGPSPVTTIEQWEALPVLDPHKGALAEFLHTLRLIAAGGDTPFLPTIFSSLSVALLLSDMRYLVWMRKYPDAFQRGLRSITETAAAFTAAAFDTGAAGIFLATNHATLDFMAWEEYKRWGVPADRAVLDVARRGWFNMLHIHGQHIMFRELADYPVQAMSWSDRTAWPSLREAKEIFPGAVCGGVDEWHTLLTGLPDAVRAEVREAIAQTGGTGYIVSSGCQTPITVAESNIRAAAEAARAG
jgi:uroporphyrinogen decarboxylase